MTTGNPEDEKFGNDEWPDETGPRGPETDPEPPEGDVYVEPKRPARKTPKKKVSRKVEKEEKPGRPSAEEAMKALKASMESDKSAPKGPKGKFSMGKGGLNSPFIMCLISAVIALVLAVAVNMYLSPNRNQFTLLTNQHNALNTSVVSIDSQLKGKASTGDLATERGRIDTQVTLTTGLDNSIKSLNASVLDIQNWKLGIIPAQYVKVTDTYSLGGNASGNISGTLIPVLSDYWTKWSNLNGNLSAVKTAILDDYDPSSVFSFGGNLSGNYSGNLAGALNKSYSNWYNLSQSVSSVSSEVDGLQNQTFNVGNCSACNISQVLQYIYSNTTDGSW